MSLDEISIEQLRRFLADSPLLAYLKTHSVTLIPTAQKVHLAELEALSSSPSQPIFLCDTPLDGIEEIGKVETYGLVAGRVTNIDHHSNLPSMQRHISSGNLALDYVRRFGARTGNELVVINHKDCDSIISSLLIRGALPLEDKFGEAVLSADHRGTANQIADLLQSLQLWGMQFPAYERFAFSVRNLELLLQEKALHPLAQIALDKRCEERLAASEFVALGGFTQFGDVALAITEAKMDPELFLPFLPEATLIMLAYPSAKDPARHEVRLRLGINPPPGLSLHKLEIESQLDAGFGGRWNAGSNRRSGGTTMRPEEYAKFLSQLLNGISQRSKKYPVS